MSKASSSSLALAYSADLGVQSDIPRQRVPKVVTDRVLIIDLFAGGGGTSEGVKMAFGRDPDIAVNHSGEALALHAHNHQDTLHLCEDIRQVNVKAVLALFSGYDDVILWASPDCRHHSKASGKKLKDKNIRGLAWQVMRWSSAIRQHTGKLPALVGIENVEEIQTWGPLHRYGKKAGQIQKKRRGETYDIYVSNLKDMGFKRVEWRELVAAKYGVPTTRKRWYLVAMSEIYEADWPKVTHAPRAQLTKQGDLFGADSGLAVFRSAASIIDWALKIPSIFGRKKGLKPKTHARIFKGIQRYVIEKADPFIVAVTHTKSERTPRPSRDPLQTLTTAKGGELAIAAPTIMPLTHDDRKNDADRVYDPLDAARTITGANRGELAIASAFLKPRYGEREGQAPRTRDIEDSAPTPVPGGNGGDLVATQLAPVIVGTAYGEHSERAGLRAWPTDEAVRGITGSNDKAMVAAYLGRQFGSTVSGRDLDDPHPTAMTDGAGGKSQVVTAHLSRMAKGSVGGDLGEDPLKTTATHAKDAVVATAAEAVSAPFIDKYYATGVAADAEDALDTATAKARFGLAAAVLAKAEATCGAVRRQVLRFLWDHCGEPTEAEVADPLATAMGRLRFGIAVIKGVAYQIIDIGMRMLTPRELFRAQGFPDTYRLDALFEGKPLTKTALIKMAGNSVCPKMAALILSSFAPPRLRERLLAA